MPEEPEESGNEELLPFVMDKINPMEYIADWRPIPQRILQASRWFETEYLSAKVGGMITGDSSNLPNVGARGSFEIIAWFMAQGWQVSSTSSGMDMHSGGGESYQIFHMQRRRLQSERVLQSMINEFTSAYNEGRAINDRRYDEIVALYDVMLDRTEDEIVATAADYANYDAIIDKIVGGLPTDADAYAAKVEGLLNDFGESHRDRINTQFDNELTKVRQSLINRGLLNSTISDSLSVGVEQNRAKALSDFEDKYIERKLVSADRVQRIRMELSSRLESATFRLLELKRARRFDATDFRNKVLTAMLAFMERRQDEYPGVGQLAELAASLGYGEGGTVATPS